MACYHPPPSSRDTIYLSREKFAEVAWTLIFLKEKRDKPIKSRACINRSPNEGDIRKQEVISPIVTNDLLFIIGTTNLI